MLFNAIISSAATGVFGFARFEAVVPTCGPNTSKPSTNVNVIDLSSFRQLFYAMYRWRHITCQVTRDIRFRSIRAVEAHASESSSYYGNIVVAGRASNYPSFGPARRTRRYH